jgi:glutamine amidotransferase
MCRLFGFRSVIKSQMHRSLVAAENALGRQSDRHPDGWGVAYYVDGAPQLTKAPAHALNDALFHRVSDLVASETVLAHVRKATQGVLSTENTHPFQYGRWVFAHNGDVPGFGERHREALLALVNARLRRYILGETDSEVVFYMFLSRLESTGPLGELRSVTEVMDALSGTIRDVNRVAPQAEGIENLLTCIVTDGTTMVAHQGGKELFFSTYKTRCSDRDTCKSLAPHCEAETRTGQINHLVLSSEVLHGENVWTKLERGDLVGTDWRMRLERRSGDPRKLAIVA